MKIRTPNDVPEAVKNVVQAFYLHGLDDAKTQADKLRAEHPEYNALLDEVFIVFDNAPDSMFMFYDALLAVHDADSAEDAFDFSMGGLMDDVKLDSGPLIDNDIEFELGGFSEEAMSEFESFGSDNELADVFSFGSSNPPSDTRSRDELAALMPEVSIPSLMTPRSGEMPAFGNAFELEGLGDSSRNSENSHVTSEMPAASLSAVTGTRAHPVSGSFDFGKSKSSIYRSVPGGGISQSSKLSESMSSKLENSLSKKMGDSLSLKMGGKSREIFRADNSSASLTNNDKTPVPNRDRTATADQKRDVMDSAAEPIDFDMGLFDDNGTDMSFELSTGNEEDMIPMETEEAEEVTASKPEAGLLDSVIQPVLDENFDTVDISDDFFTDLPGGTYKKVDDATPAPDQRVNSQINELRRQMALADQDDTKSRNLTPIPGIDERNLLCAADTRSGHTTKVRDVQQDQLLGSGKSMGSQCSKFNSSLCVESSRLNSALGSKLGTRAKLANSSSKRISSSSAGKAVSSDGPRATMLSMTPVAPSPIKVADPELAQDYLERLKPVSRIPRLLCSISDLSKRGSFNSKVGFVLSLIDGMTTLSEILDISAWPEPETAAVLLELKERGVITF